MKRIFIIVVVICSSLSLLAEPIGTPYSVLSLPYSARLSGLGGDQVSLNDGELSMATRNPSLLSDKTHMSLQLGYAFLGRGLNMATAMYGHNFGDRHSVDGKKHNMLAFGVHYLDYGKMQYADEVGVRYGSFTAKDIVFSLIYARQLGTHFSIGASLKPVYSIYESYSSFALAADVGFNYMTLENRFHLGLTLRNMGWQLKSFYSEDGDAHRESLPLDLAFGLDYKLKHAPLRFSLTAHHLQRWAIGFNSNGHGVYTTTIKEKNRLKDLNENAWETAQANGAVLWYDMLFRHLSFAIDIVPKKENFYLTFSYNHQRHAELTTTGDMSLCGFAAGAGLKIKQFRLGASVAGLSKGHLTVNVTMTAAIGDFLK